MTMTADDDDECVSQPKLFYKVHWTWLECIGRTYLVEGYWKSAFAGTPSKSGNLVLLS